MNHSHQRDISVTVLVATSEAVGALPDACDAACHLLPPPLQPPEPRLGQRGTVSPHPCHLAAPRAPREAPEPLPRFSCHPGKALCPLAACRQSSCSAGVSPAQGAGALAAWFEQENPYMVGKVFKRHNHFDLR